MTQNSVYKLKRIMYANSGQISSLKGTRNEKKQRINEHTNISKCIACVTVIGIRALQAKNPMSLRALQNNIWVNH